MRSGGAITPITTSTQQLRSSRLQRKCCVCCCHAREMPCLSKRCCPACLLSVCTCSCDMQGAAGVPPCHQPACLSVILMLQAAYSAVPQALSSAAVRMHVSAGVGGRVWVGEGWGWRGLRGRKGTERKGEEAPMLGTHSECRDFPAAFGLKKIGCSQEVGPNRCQCHSKMY